MNTKLKKYGKYLIIFTVVIFIAEFISSNWLENSTTANEAQAYLKENKEIIKKVGEIKKINLKKYISYSNKADSDSYIEYQYLVKGTKSNLFVRVRGSGNPYMYSIYSVK